MLRSPMTVRARKAVNASRTLWFGNGFNVLRSLDVSKLGSGVGRLTVLASCSDPGEEYDGTARKLREGDRVIWEWLM